MKKVSIGIQDRSIKFKEKSQKNGINSPVFYEKERKSKEMGGNEQKKNQGILERYLGEYRKY